MDERDIKKPAPFPPFQPPDDHGVYDVFLPHFRFWCQKILPLVYDDSLSYYEVLCKVAEKTNEVIEQMNDLTDAQEAFIKAVQQAFQNLINYVNSYFEGIDWQQLVDNKIDGMAAAGYFNNVFNEMLDQFKASGWTQQIATGVATPIANNAANTAIDTFKASGWTDQRATAIANAQIAQYHAQHDKNILMWIGDSYSTGLQDDGSYLPENLRLPQETAALLGLTLKLSAENGSGYINPGEHGHTFIQLFNSMLAQANTEGWRNNIKYIVIAGGRNDLSSYSNAVISQFGGTGLPVYLAPMGDWREISPNFANNVLLLNYYGQINALICLTNFWSVTAGLTAGFGSGIHPNQNSTAYLSCSITNAIRGKTNTGFNVPQNYGITYSNAASRGDSWMWVQDGIVSFRYEATATTGSGLNPGTVVATLSYALITKKVMYIIGYANGGTAPALFHIGVDPATSVSSIFFDGVQGEGIATGRKAIEGQKLGFETMFKFGY